MKVVQLADALAAHELGEDLRLVVADLQGDTLQDLFRQLPEQPVRGVNVHSVRLFALFQTQPTGVSAGRKLERVHLSGFHGFKEKIQEIAENNWNLL